MSNNYILCIDASVQMASVALANNQQLVALKKCTEQKEHAAFIQPAIQELLAQQQISSSQLAAIAVTAGPGSYTGLRVAMASAKGLCYALQIPLITINTLYVMAVAAKAQYPHEVLFCPLIDARRMEVFTAVYTYTLETVLEPQALILDDKSFDAFLSKHTVCFFGNGSAKWQQLCMHKNAQFPEVTWDASSMITPAWQMFTDKAFASLAYAAPFYLKEFQSTSKPANI